MLHKFIRKNLIKILALAVLSYIVIDLASTNYNKNLKRLSNLISNNKATTSVVNPALAPEVVDKFEIYKLLNDYRKEKGLNPLVVNTLLEKSAEKNARDMENNNYWSNNNPSGIPPWRFITDVGYNYNFASQALSIAYKTPSVVLNEWKASSINNDLLSANFKEMGLFTECGVTISTYTKQCLVVMHLGSQIVVTPQIITSPKIINTPVINNDPIIQCISTLTGIHKIKKSACDKATDCEINNKWYFYLSKKDCDNDQKKYWDNYIKKLTEDDNTNYVYTPPATHYENSDYTTNSQESNTGTIIENNTQQQSDDCKSQARKNYTELITSCNQYSGTGTYEFCLNNYRDNLNLELKNCE